MSLHAKLLFKLACRNLVDNPNIDRTNRRRKEETGYNK